MAKKGKSSNSKTRSSNGIEVSVTAKPKEPTTTQLKNENGDTDITVVSKNKLKQTPENYAKLREKFQRIEKEKDEKELKSFEIKLDIKPEYHPKIIGHKGSVISSLRKDYEVNIQLPKKEHPEQSTITITGYEANAIKARDAIMKKIGEFEAMTREEVTIDNRVHSMIIGRKGIGIRKIQQEFNVEIKLPRAGDPNPDLVIIMGSEDGVLDCKDKLLNIQEEYLQDAVDKENLAAYEKAPSREMEERRRKLDEKNHSTGFEVGKGAPWQGASDEAAFPTLGGGKTTSSVSSAPIAWGPKR
jgi:predicted PilT family ATPase